MRRIEKAAITLCKSFLVGIVHQPTMKWFNTLQCLCTYHYKSRNSKLRGLVGHFPREYGTTYYNIAQFMSLLDKIWKLKGPNVITPKWKKTVCGSENIKNKKIKKGKKNWNQKASWSRYPFWVRGSYSIHKGWSSPAANSSWPQTEKEKKEKGKENPNYPHTQPTRTQPLDSIYFSRLSPCNPPG